MPKMFRFILEAPRRLVAGYTDIPICMDDEVLIKIAHVGFCGSDLTIYNGLHPYVSYPVVMGHEFSGTVAAAGKNAGGIAIGSRVAVIPHLVCGECGCCKNGIYNFCEQLRCTGAEADGAHAEYISMPKSMVIPIPDEMTLTDAAMLEPACVAYHGAKRGDIIPGDRVLIVGAGPIGLFCLQCVKALGAGSVYVADTDGFRLAAAQKLHADGVINVGCESLLDGINRLTGSKNIDVFFDCVGEKGAVLEQILQMARRGTRIVMIGVLQKDYHVPSLPDFVQHELRLSGTTMYTPGDYTDMIGLMSKKTVTTEGLVTHTYKLRELQDVYDMIESKKEKFIKIMIDL
ncbi:MAG: alcohol dehydrogenase catalytic domain-containing protein [Defluviitaleaceae bacterium]|nr:alcohol dehydrogenase catalytic domain-containing protein [Defluviitaleaceae bacterium]